MLPDLPTRLRSLLSPLLLLAALLAGADARASDLVDRVNRQLQHPAVLRGQFEQQRQLAGFSKPMLSRGRFTVARERGALWLTDSPFSSQLILTRDALIQKNGASVSQRLDASQEPALRAINSVLFALLAGDLSALEQRFTLQGEVGARGWSLRLIPRDAAWKQVMTRIELRGSTHIDTLDMLDINKDSTHIRFLNTTTDTALRPDEVARFE